MPFGSAPGFGVRREPPAWLAVRDVAGQLALVAQADAGAVGVGDDRLDPQAAGT